MRQLLLYWFYVDNCIACSNRFSLRWSSVHSLDRNIVKKFQLAVSYNERILGARYKKIALFRNNYDFVILESKKQRMTFEILLATVRILNAVKIFKSTSKSM